MPAAARSPAPPSRRRCPPPPTTGRGRPRRRARGDRACGAPRGAGRVDDQRPRDGARRARTLSRLGAQLPADLRPAAGGRRDAARRRRALKPRPVGPGRASRIRRVAASISTTSSCTAGGGRASPGRDGGGAAAPSPRRSVRCWPGPGSTRRPVAGPSPSAWRTRAHGSIRHTRSRVSGSRPRARRRPPRGPDRRRRLDPAGVRGQSPATDRATQVLDDADRIRLPRLRCRWRSARSWRRPSGPSSRSPETVGSCSPSRPRPLPRSGCRCRCSSTTTTDTVRSAMRWTTPAWGGSVPTPTTTSRGLRGGCICVFAPITAPDQLADALADAFVTDRPTVLELTGEFAEPLHRPIG